MVICRRGETPNSGWWYQFPRVWLHSSTFGWLHSNYCSPLSEGKHGKHQSPKVTLGSLAHSNLGLPVVASFCQLHQLHTNPFVSRLSKAWAPMSCEVLGMISGQWPRFFGSPKFRGVPSCRVAIPSGPGRHFSEANHPQPLLTTIKKKNKHRNT